VTRPPPVVYDAALVEAAVLLAERRLPGAERARFRAERDRIYESEDTDEREARFEELHGRFFVQLGLDRPTHAALAEHPQVLRGVRGCRVMPAISRRDEGADLRDDLTPGAANALERGPVLAILLRPESLLEQQQLLPLLRRELLHVADMLDPGFGYERELPCDGLDPARSNLLRERYRLVWTATVEGRLAARDRSAPGADPALLSAFARAFADLGDRVEPAFDRWWRTASPRHREILEFIGAG
jgi:hypothetical protein